MNQALYAHMNNKRKMKKNKKKAKRSQRNRSDISQDLIKGKTSQTQN
jgi:hypothetical protein